MKIICYGYRSWSLNIYLELKFKTNNKIYIFSKKNDLKVSVIKKIKPDLILFYGWSWKIQNSIIENYKCMMLHPSDLPKFRGGSPIQNQIIRGINSTKLTLFRMNNIVDGGNIIYKKKLSLKGNIEDIFNRLEKIGLELTIKFLKGNYKEIKQNHSKATYYKRLINNSEITMKDLRSESSSYIFNKIRMLTDPYPNAYIKTKDNKKILIRAVKLIK